MIILGIETSCDETGAAILSFDYAQENKGIKRIQILSNVLASSASLQAKYGGIIPEQAAREQIKSIIPVIEEALLRAFEVGNEKWEFEVRNFDIKNSRNHTSRSKISHFPSQKINNSFPKTSHLPHLISKIDAIAVTYGPGLIGSLLVGVETAKALAKVWNKPLIPINHLIGHFYANFVSKSSAFSYQSSDKTKSLTADSKAILKTDDYLPQFPCLGLLVSGGHTDLVLFTNHYKYKHLGGTRDDAAGECFDKCARLLGLPYPGGPAIAQRAMKLKVKSEKLKVKLPRPLIDDKTLDFSFSGLKTALLREVNKLKTIQQFNNLTITQLACEVQEAIIEVLVKKTITAAQKYKVEQIMIAGGVAANQKLVEKLKFQISNFKFQISLHVPEPILCTDNAAMIASAAFFQKPLKSPLSLQANPNLHL